MSVGGISEKVVSEFFTINVQPKGHRKHTSEMMGRAVCNNTKNTYTSAAAVTVGVAFNQGASHLLCLSTLCACCRMVLLPSTLSWQTDQRQSWRRNLKPSTMVCNTRLTWVHGRQNRFNKCSDVLFWPQHKQHYLAYWHAYKCAAQPITWSCASPWNVFQITR